MADLNDIVEAAVLRPGDTLVVRVGRAMAPDEFDEFRDLLDKALPGARSVILAGVEQLVVQAADPDEIIRAGA